jgi:hypothetical protein
MPTPVAKADLVARSAAPGNSFEPVMQAKTPLEYLWSSGFAGAKYLLAFDKSQSSGFMTQHYGDYPEFGFLR